VVIKKEKDHDPVQPDTRSSRGRKKEEQRVSTKGKKRKNNDLYARERAMARGRSGTAGRCVSKRKKGNKCSASQKEKEKRRTNSSLRNTAASPISDEEEEKRLDSRLFEMEEKKENALVVKKEKGKFNANVRT